MQEAIEETYKDVEMLVHRICHAFMQQKGINKCHYDEWHAEACLAFVCAYRKYDRIHGCFSTWLWHSVWYALSDKLRKEAVHFLTPHLKERQMYRIVDRRSCHDGRVCFDIRTLSEDAQAVVRIVVSTTGHVDGRQAKPEEIRLFIYNLLSSFGWSFQRIVESFHEIRMVLTE